MESSLFGVMRYPSSSRGREGAALSPPVIDVPGVEAPGARLTRVARHVASFFKKGVHTLSRFPPWSTYMDAAATLRALLNADGYATRYYAERLYSSLELLVTAEQLYETVTAIGVPMMQRSKVAGLVQRARAPLGCIVAPPAPQAPVSQAPPAPQAPPAQQAAPVPLAGDDSDDDFETAVSHDVQMEDVDATPLYGAVARRAGATVTSSTGDSADSDEISSDEVVPPPKHRLFSSQQCGGAAFDLFRARLLGEGGDTWPCLANGRLCVRRSLHGAGKGLFAGDDFARGALVASYGGHFRTAAESAHHGSHAVRCQGTEMNVDAWDVCAALDEQADGTYAPRAPHLATCGLAAVANHCDAAPNTRLDCDPKLGAFRRFFAAGQQQEHVLPPVPALIATRPIARGEEILWMYPPEFVRRLRAEGAWG